MSRHNAPVVAAILGWMPCLVFLALAMIVAAAPPRTTTIPVPEGVSNHGDPHLLCTPTKWSDIIIFYLGNFFAHAATVRAYPGELKGYVIFNTVVALAFPSSGVMRGLNAIFRCSITKRDPLRAAGRAGALCMVVRSSNWEPETGNEAQDILLGGVSGGPPHRGNMLRIASFGKDPEEELLKPQDESTPSSGYRLRVYTPPWMWETTRFWAYHDTIPFSIWQRSVHGYNYLPKGYRLAFVPRDAVLSHVKPESMEGLTTVPNAISSSQSVPKALIAIVQLLYAITTLYRSRGDQINRYGYAAFGLTVAPYAIMSLMNLIGNMVTPEFPAMYLVGSEVMEEARKRGGQFDGVVGKLTDPTSRVTCSVRGSFAVEGSTVHLTVDSNNEEDPNHGDGPVNGEEASAPESPPNGQPQKTVSDTDEKIVSGTDEKGPDHREGPANGEEAPAPSNGQSRKFEASLGYWWDLDSPSNLTMFVPACPHFKRKDDDPTEMVTVQNPGQVEETRGHLLLSSFCGSLAVGAATLAIIGGLSKFHHGSSTKAQRVWTVMWIAFGVFFLLTLRILTLLWSMMQRKSKEKSVPNGYPTKQQQILLYVIQYVLLSIYAIPAIGGFVVVGQMLNAYGVCIWLD